MALVCDFLIHHVHRITRSTETATSLFTVISCAVSRYVPITILVVLSSFDCPSFGLYPLLLSSQLPFFCLSPLHPLSPLSPLLSLLGNNLPLQSFLQSHSPSQPQQPPPAKRPSPFSSPQQYRGYYNNNNEFVVDTSDETSSSVSPTKPPQPRVINSNETSITLFGNSTRKK